MIVRDDPTAVARLLAGELGAELAIGGVAATKAVARLRREPGEAPADLARLSIAMRRAERVRDRTRARAARHLARSFNTELAIHPDTLQRAARELCQIVAERQRAERGRPAAGPVLGTAARSAVAVVVSVGILAGVVGRWPIGTALLVAGLLGATVAHLTLTRRTRAKLPDLEAQEASARRRWEQLAGVGADPHDVEAVIFRYDPRQRMVADLVVHHPAVRAADRAARVHRTAWVRAWCAAVGDPYQGGEADVLDLTGSAEGPSAAHHESQPVVLLVAAPYADLTDAQARGLHHQLLTLPEGPRVIVVLGPDSRVDQITTLDLTSTNSTVDLTDSATGAGSRTDGATPALSDSGPDDAAAPVDQLKEDPQPQVR